MTPSSKADLVTYVIDPVMEPGASVDFVAAQARVDSATFADYDWSGRSIKNHRAQIRAVLGFREATRGIRTSS
jgi:Domain of unknown function (DUF4158)